MDELIELLDEIERIYNSNLSNDDKYDKVSVLWKKYYQLRQQLGEKFDGDNNVSLLYRNECYNINQNPKTDIPNNDLVKCSLIKLKEGNGISEIDVRNILDYIVYYTRQNFSYLGINVNEHSLDGLCELGQSLSIRPLEELGLSVTKNLAEDDFNYSEHHAFGTVTFPVCINDNIIMKTYLIDTTYRQFFSSTRCHEGMYYIYDEDIGSYKKPDPGYFVEDKEFAKRLMEDGYIELTSETAHLYGIPFALSGYSDVTSIDYYNNILNDKNNYVLSENELEGLIVTFPDHNNKYRI